MLTITRANAEVPDDAVRIDAVQAEQQGCEYAHLWLDEIDASCLPFGKRELAEDDLRTLTGSGPAEVRIAAADVTEADLALAAARRLLDGMSADERRKIGAIIYCHNTIAMRIGGDSTAAYLQHELGLDDALPFSVGQNHCCNAFVALELADDLINGSEAMERVMIVAADKWLFPLIRRYGDLVAFGDGAGAMLLQAAGAPGILVKRVKVRNDPLVRDPFADSPQAHARGIADFGAAVISELLIEDELAPESVELVIPQNYGGDLVRAVHRKACLTGAEMFLDERPRGHFCSADTVIGLALAIERGHLKESAAALAWGAGLNGEFACALLVSNT